jgi:hypothetical protein
MSEADDGPPLQASQFGHPKYASVIQGPDQLLGRRAAPDVTDGYCLGVNVGKLNSDVRHGKD